MWQNVVERLVRSGKENSMNSKNRDIANDLCKGLAILLMIVGHILPMHNYLRVWIYTFHMPLFFFLAGMTFKHKPFANLVTSSAKRLLIPFFLCMLGSISLYCIFGNKEMILARALGLVFPDSYKLPIFGYHNPKANAAALWFLVALFWSRIYFNGLYKSFSKTYLLISLCITIFCGYVGKYWYNLPFAMLIGGCAVGYMALGKWFSENRNVVNKISWWIWICFIPIWLFSAYRFYFEMYGFSYQKRAYIIGVIVACVASMLIYLCAHMATAKIPSKWYRWLEWCGLNSLVILICHFFAQEIITIVRMAYDISLSKTGMAMGIVFGTFGLLCLWIVSKKFLGHLRAIVLQWSHKRDRYLFKPTDNGWMKFHNNPVIGDEGLGTVFDPYVFKDNGMLRMVYSKRKNGSLVLTSSTDGIEWVNEETILKGISDSWERIVNRGCLLKHGDKWHLWYTGQNNGKSCIGYAESFDGRNFTRISTQPVLQAEMSFEGISVMNPCVKWNEKRKLYQMWYAAGEDYEPDVICYAESTDGITWAKHNSPVLLPYKKHKWERFKVGGCDIYEKDGIYIMYYIGYQNIDVARICYAISEDGISWKRPDRNLLLSPSEGSWDADACYKPTVVLKDSTLMLWYNGRKKTAEYIGLATKKK